ncbi:response regulator [Actinomadura kijaniata]|uniref:CheY-like chemotaxis protein n=1 Tax=Actinomadura namibiensis TaxID=182080 RepID=A0A7W3LYZ3_ACTNM|nr:response regulator [Actinomadura namibiensis]MBA8956926.1 CheY-like chemotaxis protein [Actinomadura namibiensis]
MDDKAKILLVDDREENLIALEAILSSLDQDLVRARSGEEALKALLTDEYAVILLDVVMPGMDGFETARDIKRRKKTRDLPIIFLTAVNSDPDYAFRGYAAGAVDFISKPFDPWVLRAKVSVFVELHNKNRQLRDQTALLREQAALLREQAALLRERPPEPAAGPDPAVAERLAAVEEQAAALGKRVPAELRAEAERLDERVAALREALDGDSPDGGSPEGEALSGDGGPDA